MEAGFDPYLILGVSTSASDAEIQKAYRRLALTMHPDHNQGDVRAKARFQQVQRAYDLLRDASKRRAYDSGVETNSSPTTSHASQVQQQEMTCPICGGTFAVSTAALQQTFYCVLCNAHLTMPGTESAAPPPPPPPPHQFVYAAQVQANETPNFRIQTKNRVRPRSLWERIGWFTLAMITIRILMWLFK
jgi:curved DNA-binding protein CbpA